MTNRNVTMLGIALMGMLFAASLASSQAVDPWIGTWKLNLEKSKFSPGPPPKSTTLKIEPVAGGHKHTFDGVNAQGQTTHSERVFRADGVDVPTEASVPASKNVVTNAFRKRGDHSYEVVVKVDGKVTTTNQAVVSSDGKTLTNTVTGTNAQGQPVNSINVFEKQ